MPAKQSANLDGVRVLFVDDEPQILRALQRGLATVNCDVLTANSAEQALELLAETPADIVVSDMRMPNMKGTEFLQIVAQKYPDTIRMVLTGHADIQSVISSINHGHIWGYLEKPWDNDQLIIALEQAIFTQKIYSERAILRRNIDKYARHSRSEFSGFIGRSIVMQAVYKAIEYCAPSAASVFITGASGTGKEVAAAAVHALSPRSNKPFIAINCAAIPRELMESEIFGHTKGAFSGAVSNREGAASLANGGTLFLDELGEMDIGLQAKLLRFIQTGQFQKVGSDKLEQVDIRFVCATNRNPLEAIKEKSLREDLYYRLNVVSIQLPPLCERESDSVLLARHFLQKISQNENKMFVSIDEKAETIIRNYRWPGNVRQLENAIYSAVVMSEGPTLSVDAIRFSLRLSQEAVQDLLSAKVEVLSDTLEIFSSNEKPNIIPLADVERFAIERAIQLFSGNVVDAASALGVSPSTLYRKIQQWQH